MNKTSSTSTSTPLYRKVVTAACDGACRGNPGPGGWGCLLRYSDGTVEELGGFEAHTTNNRMELSACLALLKRLKELPKDPGFAIRTDSKYLIDGYSRWLPGWKRKGWRTASGGAVLNRDLWEELDAARLPDVALEHVKGHSGDPDNERCDQIAVAYSRKEAIPNQEQLKTTAKDQDLAPAPLKDLLTRLELADRLAQGGYLLKTVEIAQLLEQPLATFENRDAAITWRDWRVAPQKEGGWRLERLEQN
ncbi:ribonuclease H [Synechococcus sp. UW140]|uniref:ribonuclease H family protein n=1 Tax=Synechococcus sp. UW140 TaxID=368503 RepID=UPI0025FA8033|nr:ribonuclease H [Synechococcus sp. UW140]